MLRCHFLKIIKQINVSLFLITVLIGHPSLAADRPSSNNHSIKTMSQTNKNTILVLGDSLSAEYGLPKNTGWVHYIEKKLIDQNLPYKVYNASISGETTSGGASRIPALVKQLKPKIVVIELGANDALRGVPLNAMQANLETIIRIAKQTKARVLLIGMKLPPNYGHTYNKQFVDTFQTLSKQFQIELVPFLLEGIADNLDYFQQDQIHPNQSAQIHLFKTVWPNLHLLINSNY